MTRLLGVRADSLPTVEGGWWSTRSQGLVWMFPIITLPSAEVLAMSPLPAPALVRALLERLRRP